MDNFWEELGTKMRNSFEDIEKHREKNFSMIKNIPEVLSYLKDLNSEDLMLLVDQARKIKKRKKKNLDSPPVKRLTVRRGGLDSQALFDYNKNYRLYLIVSNRFHRV